MQSGSYPAARSEALEGALRHFRAGRFREAAAASNAALQSALGRSQADFEDAAEALVLDARLQPLFSSRQVARESVPFFRWLATALDSALGPAHLTSAFARVRLCSALAVAGEDSEADAHLDTFFRCAPIAEFRPPAATTPPATGAPTPAEARSSGPAGGTSSTSSFRNTLTGHRPPSRRKTRRGYAVTAPTPDERPSPTPRKGLPDSGARPIKVCSHLAPLLDHARDSGATVAAAFESMAQSHRYWLYLDGVVFDTAALRQRFALPRTVIDHTELLTGPRPCHGFFCTDHRDAVLGLHPERARGARHLR